MPIFPTGYTNKTTPHDNDNVLIGDSQASDAIKKTKISAIITKATAAAVAAVQALTNWITTDMLKDASVTSPKIDFTTLGYSAVNDVATSQTTTSATFVALATAQDVTLNVGRSGMLIVQIGANMTNNTAFGGSFVSFALSGANTLAASNTKAVGYQSAGGGNYGQQSGTFILTGLTPGSTTVTMLFRRETAGTSTFSTRSLSAFSL